jgi:hypothetical protein
MTKATIKAALKGYGSNIKAVKARLAFAFFKVVAGPIRWSSETDDWYTRAMTH